MTATNDDIRMAQVRAGEQVVVNRLRAKGLVDDDDRPHCPNEATIDDLRVEDITEVRRGPYAHYPHDRMVRLLAGGEKVPRWRRLLRRLHLMK